VFEKNKEKENVPFGNFSFEFTVSENLNQLKITRMCRTSKCEKNLSELG
jgi:hypothetical protein